MTPANSADSVLVWLDIAFKVFALFVGSGALWKLIIIARDVGSYQKWMETINKEVASHGSMLEQLNKDVSHINGFLSGQSRES